MKTQGRHSYRSGRLLLGGLVAGLMIGTGALAQVPPPPLLKPGDSGAAVDQLQQQLAQVDLYTGAIDGRYGAATVQAVRSLQQQQNLPIDGVAGPQTWQALRFLPGSGLTLASPLRADILTFTPLVVAQPEPPPSALWLAIMPLVPITGGAVTYLHRRINRRWARRRRAQRRLPPTEHR